MLVITNTQKAIYALLSEELSMNIFDFVDEEALLPYITIGDSAVTKRAALGKNQFEVNLNIHAYDNSKGRKLLLEIGQEIFELLDSQVLQVEDFEHYETSLNEQSVELIDNAEKYELTANYKIILGEAD